MCLCRGTGVCSCFVRRQRLRQDYGRECTTCRFCEIYGEEDELRSVPGACPECAGHAVRLPREPEPVILPIPLSA